jgi:hypothetical protein
VGERELDNDESAAHDLLDPMASAEVPGSGTKRGLSWLRAYDEAVISRLEGRMMKRLAGTMLLATVLLAGCSGIEMGAPTPMSEQALCEQQRGGGVWMSSAGACIRGGGGG